MGRANGAGTRAEGVYLEWPFCGASRAMVDIYLSWDGIGWRCCMVPICYYAESRHYQSDSKCLAGLSVCEVGSLDWYQRIDLPQSLDS